jgi:hypothetical protein
MAVYLPRKWGRDYFIRKEDLKLVANRKPGSPRKVMAGLSSKANQKEGHVFGMPNK